MEDSRSSSERYWFLRRPTQFLLDAAVLAVAFLIAYLPAVNIRVVDFYFDVAVRQLPFAILIQVSVLFLLGAYSILWRYISLDDLKIFVIAGAVSGSILLALRFLLGFVDFPLWQIPISVILIDTVLGFGGLVAVRVIRRFIYELGGKSGRPRALRRATRKPVLLVGAGRVGAMLVRDTLGRADGEIDILALIDDDRGKIGKSVSGRKVVGTTADLPKLVSEFGAEQVVIAIGHAEGTEIRRIVEICNKIPVKTQIVPSLHDIVHGRVEMGRVRDVQIEDLLGRDPVDLDDGNLRQFLGEKTVMVTGAGGSIGSELVRQVLEYDPEKVLLVERSEFNLFTITREVEQGPQAGICEPLIADVGDEARMREIFDRYRPEIILHAAAHKHVALMEANPIEAIKNNVLATRGLGRLAGDAGVRTFVLISTDKAVNPTSMMGGSKRLAEIALQDLNREFETNFLAVRFGNVLGSAGSVVPIFREQIERGQPLTVTDREMRRYFMTVPEASQLVLQAAAIGAGGEIFILDMGEPVRILDLAEDMIRLSGLEPYTDIPIVFTGARPGEKLFEELEITGEGLLKTRHPKIFIGKIATYGSAEVLDILGRLRAAVEDNDPARLRAFMNEVLPEASIDRAAGAFPKAETNVDSETPANEIRRAENGSARLGLASE